MKRTGNLIDKIAEPENIRLAFFKAIKGKRDKKDANNFSGHLHYEIPEIHHELLSGDVHWGTYFRFKIYDPKEREICAASFRERVIHHAIINICEPVFEEYQISDSYACRKGKGLDAAIDRAQGCSEKSPWFLKMDIRKYFDSIDHEILKKTIRRKFKDKTLLNLFDQIIDGYFKVPGKGVPIGNLTSQYFANHYLALFDHYIKEEKGSFITGIKTGMPQSICRGFDLSGIPHISTKDYPKQEKQGSFQKENGSIPWEIRERGMDGG
jgi:retron-type reverse transcriptase